MAGIILSEAIGRTNWSPLSGMTLIAVTLLIMITQAFGGMSTGPANCCCGDGRRCNLCGDESSNRFDVGSKNWLFSRRHPQKQQQLGQFAGAWLGPIVIIIFNIYAR